MNNFYINQDSQSLYSQFLNATTDYYALLQREMEALTPAELSELNSYSPYIQANKQLSDFLQLELINLVRRQLNSKPEIIKNVIESIKSYKNEKQQELSDFNDYIKNFSDLTYNEYKKLKDETK